MGLLARLVSVGLSVELLSRLYIVFITELGQPGSRAGAAYWGMCLVSLLLGLAVSLERPSLPRGARPWARVLSSAGLIGFALFRAGPGGYLAFGVTPWANSWVPPALAAALGAFVAREFRAR